MYVDLKPCPICGGDAVTRFDGTEGMKGTGAYGYASVACRMCGSMPYIVCVYTRDDEKNALQGVREMWNRRAERSDLFGCFDNGNSWSA